MQADVAEPQIVGGARALIGRDEWNAPLRRRVGVVVRPVLPAVVGLEDRGAGGREQDVRLVRRDGKRAASGRQRLQRRPGRRRPGRAAIGRPTMPVVTTDVDDAAVVDDDVPDGLCAVGGRRIDEVPRHAGVGAHRQAAIGADEHSVGVRGIDRRSRKPQARFASVSVRQKSAGGVAVAGLRPGCAAIGADVDPDAAVRRGRR